MFLFLFLLPYVVLSGGPQTQYVIAPTTTLTLKGTSTLHDFECTTTNIQGTIEMDSLRKVFTRAAITIPVKDIHSGNSSMDENMYESLKAEEYPSITFLLERHEVLRDTVQKLIGKLTISGTEKSIEIPITIQQKRDGTLSVSGKKKILMTDFGIKPPSFMFGALKTGNEVTIEFAVDLKETKFVKQ